MKNSSMLALLFFSSILPLKGEKGRYLWEILIETDPSIIADGVVTRGSKKALILKSEQNGVETIIQKFINVKITDIGKVYFVNRAFEITSGQFIADIKKNKHIVLEDAYVMAGSNEDINLITVPIKEISGKVKPLVITRQLIGGLDIYVIEAVLDNDQVRHYQFPKR